MEPIGSDEELDREEFEAALARREVKSTTHLSLCYSGGRWAYIMEHSQAEGSEFSSVRVVRRVEGPLPGEPRLPDFWQRT
jgi:hypothetical protein